MLSSAALVIVSLSNLLLALLIYFRNRRNAANIFFSIMILGTAFWAFCLLMFNRGNPADVYLWGQLTYFFVNFTIFFYLLFSFVFPTGTIPKGTTRVLLYLLFAVFFPITLIPKSIFSSIVVTSDGIVTTLNWAYYVHSLITFILFTWIYFNIVTKLRKSKGTFRAQLLYIFVGTLLSTIIAIVANVVLFKFTTKYNWVGPTGTMIMVGCIAYAIVKHRLMDIRLMIVRSISFSLLLLVMVGGFAYPLQKIKLWAVANNLSYAERLAIDVTAIVFIGLMIPLVRKLLTKITDRLFFKGEYDADDFQKEVSNILSSNIVLAELLHKTLDFILKEFRLYQGMFVVAEGDKIYTVQSIGYRKPPKVDFADVRRLSHFSILTYDELEEGSRAKSYLRKYEASVMVPLSEEHQFAGILLLGEKKSGDMFSANDIRMLEIIAPEIAIAMQRAKQYEEIQKFNVTLRAEVIRQTKKLKEANVHLQELDKAKDEFISMASHQLRTPLTAIKGYLSMLLEGDAGEIKVGQFDFVNEAFQASTKMVALINDLLNISRMSTGKFFIEPRDIDMKAMINEEVHQLAGAARQKGIYLKFEYPKKLPVVEADENKIRQVIMNFIDNAIHYTEKGGVTVRVSASKHDFVLEVHDTGIGVPREVQNRLFAKFYRADNARRLRPDGNGLGLYLAKRVIEDHGGEIIFRSTPGKGSVFGFRIPIKSKLKVDSKKRLLAA